MLKPRPMRSLLLVLAAVLPSTTVFADPCERLLLGHNVEIVLEEVSAPPAHVQSVISTIERADKLFSHLGLKPGTLKLSISETDSDALHFRDSIAVPFRLEKSIDGEVLSKSPKQTEAVIVHEYAHWILDRFLELEGHPATRAEAAYRVFEARKDELMAAHKFSELVPLLPEGLRLAKEMLRIRETHLIYSEFFADLAAVLYAGDPRAVADVLSFPGDFADPVKVVEDFKLAASVAKPIDYYRSFAVERPLEEWIESSEAHCILGPSRGFAWKLFQRSYKQRPELFLEKAAQAIRTELLQRAAEPTELSPTQVNRSFMERLRLRLEDV